MSTIVEEIKEVLNDAKQIETATDYGSYLMHGNICDSSPRKDNRLKFVGNAEHQFIREHKQDILKLAAKLCRESIGDVRELINIEVLK